MDLVSDEELAAASSGLEVPSGLYGFGNYLVWMVATRAPELVDAVYGSGVARPSPEYRMRDGHHLPTQSMFGWLILACRLGVDPARLPRGDRNLVSTQRSLAATMTPAMGAEPQRFRAEWLRDLAAVCGLDRAELRFLEVARSRFGVGLDPGELRLAVEATRAAGLPAGRHGGPGGGAAGPSAGPSAGTADRPGGAADGVIPDQLVIGPVPREPRGFVVRGLVGVLADAAAAGPVAVVCAVTGLRGVGKTQLAAAYARERIRAGWGLIGWIDAESRGTMVTGLAAVAGRLRSPAVPRGRRPARARQRD
jgi:hypothetical protein